MNQQRELIPMAAGEYLKQRRKDRRISLATVAKTIHLDEKLLRKIEDGGADQIAPVYRNGYIKQYARYLQVADDEIQALVATAENEDPPIHTIFSEPLKRNPLDNWLHATSYVLASLLIGTLAWQFTHEAVRLSQNGSGLQNMEEGAVISASTNKQRPAQTLRGSVNASIAPLGTLHKNKSDGLDTAEQAWAAVSRPVLAGGESQMVISVSADSWVEITDASGEKLEMDLLRAGSEKSYHGTPPFRFLFGRASAVRLSMDGSPVDITAHTRDDVAQLTWPQKSQAGASGSGEN
jgi:cytoskeleton protein RodZ